jgi:hypothetical protein
MLCEQFKIRDLGEAKQCLGIRISREDGKIILDQEKYVEDVLSRFEMSECNLVKIPMDVPKFQRIYRSN